MEGSPKMRREDVAKLQMETNVKVKEFLKASPTIESIGEKMMSPFTLKPEQATIWEKEKRGGGGPPGECLILNPLCNNELFRLVRYNELGMVHCTYQRVTG